MPQSFLRIVTFAIAAARAPARARDDDEAIVARAQELLERGHVHARRGGRAPELETLLERTHAVGVHVLQVVLLAWIGDDIVQPRDVLPPGRRPLAAAVRTGRSTQPSTQPSA